MDAPLDMDFIRGCFPILRSSTHGRPLVYLDNAATMHKPIAVMARAQRFYNTENANIHRGMHALATRATSALEETRLAVQRFIGAAEPENIIFTSGTTESINLIAESYGNMLLHAGDEVLISEMEHHSNLVPWQRLCQRKQAVLKAIPIDKAGQLDLTHLEQLLTKRTKIVAINYVSNTLGTINPIKALIAQAHVQGAVVVVDGAQAVAHLPIDVADLDCDFFAFSAHKLYGLSGLGFLYGKKSLLEAMPPYQTGGGMVQKVTLSDTIYQAPPYKFEAGTPPLASIASFPEAIQFLLEVGYDKLSAHEHNLLTYALDGLARMPAIALVGAPVERTAIIAFNVADMHHLDVGLLLDAQGIAVRTGHCCTQPLLEKLGLEGVVRISFAVYNTMAEVDFFLDALAQVIQKYVQ